MLLIITIPLLMGAISAQAVRTFLSNPSHLKSALANEGFYESAEDFLVSRFEGEVPLEHAEITQLIRAILPPREVERLTGELVDGLHAWLWSQGAMPQLVLDFSPVRSNVRGSLRPILQARVDALPTCSATQLATLLVTYDDGVPPCKLPDDRMNQEMIDRAIEKWQPEQLVPATLDVASLLEESSPGTWYELRSVMSSVRLGLELISYLWIVVATLLALVLVLNMDRWYTPLGWVGSALIIAALPLFLPASLNVLPRLGGWLEVAQAAVAPFQTVLWQVSLSVLVAGGACILVAIAGRMYDQPEHA